MTKLENARSLVRLRLDVAIGRSQGHYPHLIHLLMSRARHDQSFREALIRVACADLALSAANPDTIPASLKGH